VLLIRKLRNQEFFLATDSQMTTDKSKSLPGSFLIHGLSWAM
jgi:hypothetical protein